jgi:predicted transcriptional regulator
MAKIIQFPDKRREVSEIESEFPDRLDRIRRSLDKINRLMSELKQMSKKESQDVNSGER